MKIHRSTVGKGLRTARLARGLSQEEFDVVSGRTYVSAVERGTKQLTVAKLDELAAVMKLHPLTVLTLSYCKTPSQREAVALMNRVASEIAELIPGSSTR